MARNTLEKVRDCMKYGKPEITWQPEFDRAKEVLTRSLLNPPVKPAPAPTDDHPHGD
jgi:quinolinate synthase